MLKLKTNIKIKNVNKIHRVKKASFTSKSASSASSSLRSSLKKINNNNNNYKLNNNNKINKYNYSSKDTGNFGQKEKIHDVLLMKGDGIGTEICDAAIKVIDATGVNIKWKEMKLGYEEQERTGIAISEEHVNAFDDIPVLFKGPLTVQGKSLYEIRGKKFTSPNQAFRKLFELYANVRPTKTTPGVPSRYTNVDIVTIRENTEDVYTGEETWVDPDTVEGIKRITRKGSERIAHFAFDYALKNGRELVTAAHKANVCKKADGLFLDTFIKVAGDYPQIKYADQLADSLLTKLVIEPENFDVLCCPNLYGDMVSDLCGGLIGSLGLCGSGQFGTRHALFEPCHGSAPDIAGQGSVNPVSQIRSGIMLLEYLREVDAAKQLGAAVDLVLKENKYVTRDLGGIVTTERMTEEIIKKIEMI